MLEHIQKSIDEFVLLADICQQQIDEGTITVTLEAYIKGQLKGYDRAIKQLEELKNIYKNN